MAEYIDCGAIIGQRCSDSRDTTPKRLSADGGVMLGQRWRDSRDTTRRFSADGGVVLSRGAARPMDRFRVATYRFSADGGRRLAAILETQRGDFSRPMAK
mmetsp:Transcript_30039/g.73175  ORF Transcript_30039/g.73175 Transcript_30039/m.73175 type:complete len:100 (+) Transcript_30039:2483-2782(+)